MLDLRRPIYKQTASYGHFGRTMWICLGEAGQGGFIEEIPGIVTSHAKMKQELFPGVYSQGTVPVLIFMRHMYE